MNFCDKVDEMAVETLFFIASGQDGRSKAARALRRKHSLVWAAATDEDLKKHARQIVKRFDFSRSYSKLLSWDRKARAIHRKRIKDPRCW